MLPHEKLAISSPDNFPTCVREARCSKGEGGVDFFRACLYDIQAYEKRDSPGILSEN